MDSASKESNKRRIGNTDIIVSPVGLGCWPIAGMTSLDVNDKDSLATIREAIDCGINFIDTAHCYGANGESEILVGKAIERSRDDLVIASKGGIHWDAEEVRHYNGSPKRLIYECDESLRRMKIETIDLFYLHAPDPETPVTESAEAFGKLLDAGKIRSVGASNFSLEQLEAFHAVCPIAAIQPPYNLLQRDIETDVIPWCLANDISVFNYWPLMKGLLAGKIRRGHNFAPEDNRLNYEVFQGEKFETAQRLLDGLDQIAKELGKTVSQIVVNWTFHQPGITSTLCGAKRDWQIRETAGAMDWTLDQNSLNAISELIEPPTQPNG